VLLSHAVEPVLCVPLTLGKNAADMALSVDAMDLLYGGFIDTFCIVSSDSDFTPLTLRIRRDGARVYGFGARHTPEAFVGVCDKFIYTETLEG